MSDRPPSPTSTTHADLAAARTMLTLLAAICMFGSGLAFEALHAVPGRESTFLAWAFTAFAIGIAVTLIWQAALVEELRAFSGTLYCSRRGTVLALATGLGAMTLGILFLGLAMTRSSAAGARAAGYAVVAATVLILCAALLRPAAMALRRVT